MQLIHMIHLMLQIVMVDLEVVELMIFREELCPQHLILRIKEVVIHPLLVLLKDNQVEVEIIVGLLLLLVAEEVELQMQVQ